MASAITKPMLAVRCTDMHALHFPVLATPKLDGIRCIVVGGKALSRKFLPIPNVHIRTLIEDNFPDGIDGEIIIPGTSFNGTSSAVMRHDGTPSFRYFVFDYVPGSLQEEYHRRMKDLAAMILSQKGEAIIERVLPVEIHNVAELEKYEAKCIEEGFEGAMVRTPDSPYKLGRSTEKEGYLLKIKRFQDDEAKVLNVVELLKNENEAAKDNIGHTKRSTNAEGMVPQGTLGAVKVKDVKSGVEFSIGSGFTAAQRDQIWKNRKTTIGKIVTYKHQPSGALEGGAPRFPVFKSFRDPRDMD